MKAEQEKQRRGEAISNTTGIRVFAAIGSSVPVRLMKRDLLFVVERLAGMLDENRLAIVARQHGIKKTKDSDSIAKLFTAFRRAEESLLGRTMVELTIVLAASPAKTQQGTALFACYIPFPCGFAVPSHMTINTYIRPALTLAVNC